MKLEYKRRGVQSSSQRIGYVNEIHVWLERQHYLGIREAVYSHTERTSLGYGCT